MTSDDIMRFVAQVRRDTPPNCVEWSLRVTSDGYDATLRTQDGVDLERAGTAKRNLRGEWIVPDKSKEVSQ